MNWTLYDAVYLSRMKTKSNLKIRILVQDQGGSEFQPAGILKYVEDLKRGTNAEIEPKNFFEMTSKLKIESAIGQIITLIIERKI